MFSKISFDVFDKLILLILLILALTSSALVEDHMFKSKLKSSGSYIPNTSDSLVASVRPSSILINCDGLIGWISLRFFLFLKVFQAQSKMNFYYESYLEKLNK